MSQQERIQLKKGGGSKGFTRRPQINASGVYGYNPDRSDPEGRILAAGGFDKLKVANKASVDVEIQLGMNPDRSHYIEAGTQEILEDIQPFGSYKVVNLDSGTSISAGELTLTAKLTAMTADDAARLKQQQDDGLDAQALLGLAGGLM